VVHNYFSNNATESGLFHYLLTFCRSDPVNALMAFIPLISRSRPGGRSYRRLGRTLFMHHPQL